MSAKIKKYLVAILILSQVILLPGLVFATGSAVGPVSAIPISDGGTLASNAAFQTLFVPIVAANTACAKAETLFGVSNNATQGSASGLSLISGGSATLTQLGNQLTFYNGFENCRQNVADSLTVLPTTNLYNDNQRQSLLTQVNASIQAWKAKEDQTVARINNASQGFWKTLVFNILLQTTKSVADALVTKLVNNYKITNVKQYIDSTATLMYDNQYLRDNFPDAQGQLMARAILNQPELRSQIQPGIFVAANAALGFNPSTLSPSDPQFYQKMAMVGNTSANPYYLQTAYVGNVDAAHAQAIGQAQNLVSQSQGYKTPVNCAGSLAQQKQIDLQAKAASDQLANRQALLASLQAAGSAASQSDLAKAQADYNNALIAWNNIPYTVTGTSSVSSFNQGNNTEGTMAIAMCEAISSPATLINKGIDAAFNAYVAPLSQYNNNNLPTFITLISQVASQIGSNLIFGGTGAAKGAALANEGTLVNAGVTAVNQTIANTAASTTSNSITFIITANPLASSSNNYQVNWSVDDSAVPGADHINIVGDGVPSSSSKLPLSGTTTIITTTGGNYTLTVFDSTNNVLASRTANITIAPHLSLANSSQAVLGAYTDKPSLEIRGPRPEFSPRGE